MAATREAGDLVPGDLIEVEHQEHDGPPCSGCWTVKTAIVDQVDVALVACDGKAVVGWHDQDHPTCCGVMSVGAHTRVPYRGREQQGQAAA